MAFTPKIQCQNHGRARMRYSRHKATSLVLAAPVVCILAALVRKGWLDLDTAWDSLAYHLPFAALRTRILSPSEYHLSHWIGACYAGFPVLPDYLQGWLWRIAGRPQGANFVGLIALLALSSFLWRSFRLPLTDTLLAFLAVPIVLIQSTSAYVDLLTNCAMTAVLLILFRAVVWPASFSMKDLVGALAALAIAMNCKLQFVPIGTLALLSLIGILFLQRTQIVRFRSEFHQASRSVKLARIALVLFAIGLCYSKPLENWRTLGNPVYPVALRVGPFDFKGQFQQLGAEPLYLAHVPQPVRWALSVLEYNAFDGRRPLWTNGQGDLAVSSPALRMGGYFAAFVSINALLFPLLQLRTRHRYGWKPAVFLVITTVVTAALPASQELRYYLYWMLMLLSVNLFLIFHGLSRDDRFQMRLIFVAVTVSCLLFVISSNDGSYLRSTGATADKLTLNLGITRQLSDMNLRPGEAVCVIGKNPLTFLYAPIFNQRLTAVTRYGVFEAYSQDDCAGKRAVP